MYSIGIAVAFLVVVTIVFLGVGGISWLTSGFSSGTNEEDTPWNESATQVVMDDDEVMVVPNPPAQDAYTVAYVLENQEELLGETITVQGYTQDEYEGWGYTMSTTPNTLQDLPVMTIPDELNSNSFENTNFEEDAFVVVSGSLKEVTTPFAEENGFVIDGFTNNPWVGQVVLVATEIEMRSASDGTSKSE